MTDRDSGLMELDITPDGMRMAALDRQGIVSIWDLPALEGPLATNWPPS